MQLLGQDHKVWIAIAVATAFKLMTSKDMSLPRAVASVVAAVFSAWAFTDAALDLFSLNPATYQIPIAALLALTGEGAMRWLTSATPESFIDLIRKVRGK